MLRQASEQLILVLRVQPFPQAVPRRGDVFLGEVLDHEVEVLRVGAPV